MSTDLQWITASFIQNYIIALKKFPPSAEVDKYRAKAEEILRITLKTTDEHILQSCHTVLHSLINRAASYRLVLELKEMRDKRGK